jgi:YVTN family beta-propeller protein
MARIRSSEVLFIGLVGLLAAGAASGLPRSPKDGGYAPRTLPTFVNWETPQVHPIDKTPDGTRLLVTNTADNRLEVFTLAPGFPSLMGEIPVGLDPVSVRPRAGNEVWVVNQISDSISIVDLSTMNVVKTIKTKDEPCDVVFAGSPQRAFVTCGRANMVQVFDPANLSAAPTNIPIDGNDPRSLAVSPDGSTVYAAIFESGNASTILGGGGAANGTRLAFPPDVVSDAVGPYGGTNPPPNSGTAFSPPIAAANLPTNAVGLIVKKNAAGQWMDDNNHDWTSMVSGANASHSGRPVGWDLPDHDLAVISASTLSVSYATGLMNICMSVSVNPATGQVTVVGTDATNEVRFEPNVKGKFTRVNMATVNPATLGKSIIDLNPHLLPYAVSTLPQSERDKSLGDPRGIVWMSGGTKGYVSGMGSNNVIAINTAGGRADGPGTTITVGEGPTGLCLDEARGRLYVLNKFAASVSVINLSTDAEITRVSFFDPSPAAIKVGRKHLYDTHKNSGLGQLACGSCHVDARMDRLAWDLGDPQGTIANLTDQDLNEGFNFPGLEPNTTPTAYQNFHPMKGPMTTQTLQDIIGHEPFHWRADRRGLENFGPAFESLNGDDTTLTTTEMQEFEDFLATIYFPPNPNRNFDNTLPTSMPLTGHYATGRFTLAAGSALPNGNAQNGLAIYRSPSLRFDGNAFACVTCHTLPTGGGTDSRLVNAQTNTYQAIAVGPQGQHHVAVVSVDGSTNVTIKIPSSATSTSRPASIASTRPTRRALACCTTVRWIRLNGLCRSRCSRCGRTRTWRTWSPLSSASRAATSRHPTPRPPSSRRARRARTRTRPWAPRPRSSAPPTLIPAS